MSQLSQWLHTHYDFLKDFAGPIAAVTASAVAASITVRLGKGQAAIAKAQADIARDKLKFDLFELRYGIYKAVKELVEHETRNSEFNKIDHEYVRSMYVKFDEARFFFDQETISFIDSVGAASEAYLNLLGFRWNSNFEDDQLRTSMAEQLAECVARLRELYATAPAAFERSLKFGQVIG